MFALTYQHIFLLTTILTHQDQDMDVYYYSGFIIINIMNIYKGLKHIRNISYKLAKIELKSIT